MVSALSFVLTRVANFMPCGADWSHPVGEWAIARLKAEAAQHLHDASHAAPVTTSKDPPVAQPPLVGPIPDPKTTTHKPEENSVAPNDPVRIGRYHCIYGKVQGNLSLDTEGIYFELHLTAKEKWRLKYTDLKSVQKVSPHDPTTHSPPRLTRRRLAAKV